MVSGTNFVAGSQVSWNGVGRATSYVSATTVMFNALDVDVTAPGRFAVTVTNPGGGGTSNTANFTVTPVPPKIISVSPTNAGAGDGAFSLAVLGANFSNGMVVQWNRQNRTTTYQSPISLAANIGASDIAAVGSASVRVINPATGDSSNTATFTVTPFRAPQISALSPPNGVVGSNGLTLTVQGSNFAPGMVVQTAPGGQTPTTYVNGFALTATLSTQDLSLPAILAVNVLNPSTGQLSNAANFVVSTLTTLGPTIPIPTNLWQPPSGAIPSSGTFLYVESDPGDPVGSGQTHLFTGPSSMLPMVSRAATATELDIGGWHAAFATPASVPQFVKGYYASAQRFPFNTPGFPGLTVYGDGALCDTVTGWFVIDDVAYTGTTLSAFTARFEQHCGAATPAVRGALHWSR
jgi:hypothetical protein